jgi:hypothetical protein
MPFAPFALVRNPTAQDPRIVALRRELDAFYASVQDYEAFVDPGDNGVYHRLLAPSLRKLIAQRERVTVLEYGSGRTTFATFLEREGLRHRVRFIAQDVTSQNEAHLRSVADDVIIGDIAAVTGPVHMAFSTFVLEHVASPVEHLIAIARLLTLGGVHAIFCPNYELPGYLCPSLRHLAPTRRALAALFLATSRLAAEIDRAPRFWVNGDPAVRHVDWYRDADAVYIASRRELERWHRARGFTVERLRFERPPATLAAWRGHLVRDAITTMLASTKTREAVADRA